jgi:hypothetical protein
MLKKHDCVACRIKFQLHCCSGAKINMVHETIAFSVQNVLQKNSHTRFCSPTPLKQKVSGKKARFLKFRFITQTVIKTHLRASVDQKNFSGGSAPWTPRGGGEGRGGKGGEGGEGRRWDGKGGNSPLGCLYSHPEQKT